MSPYLQPLNFLNGQKSTNALSTLKNDLQLPCLAKKNEQSELSSQELGDSNVRLFDIVKPGKFKKHFKKHELREDVARELTYLKASLPKDLTANVQEDDNQ